MRRQGSRAQPALRRKGRTSRRSSGPPWFARDGELVAFDPDAGTIVRRVAVPAGAGTAFDGENLYQLADGEILVVRPSDGRVLRKLPAPGKGGNSGMAWADGYLWVGEYRAAKIHQIDAKTGELVKTLASDRFVTGVSVVDGALWHGVSDEELPVEGDALHLALAERGGAILTNNLCLTRRDGFAPHRSDLRRRWAGEE